MDISRATGQKNPLVEFNRNSYRSLTYQEMSHSPGSSSSRSTSLFSHSSTSKVIPNDIIRYQQQMADILDMTGEAVTKVLLIYYGGTMGMRRDEHAGYVPVKGHLRGVLASIPCFHDAEFMAGLAKTASSPRKGAP